MNFLRNLSFLRFLSKPSSLQAPAEKRILLWRFGAMGDMILLLPTLHSIKKHCPEVFLTVATFELYGSLLVDHPAIDKLILLSRQESFWQQLHKLQESRADVILDMHGKARSFFFAKALGLKVYTFKGRSFKDRFYHWLSGKAATQKRPYSKVYHDVLQRYLKKQIPYEPLLYQASAKAILEVEHYLRKHQLNKEKLLGICPGAMWNNKRWPMHCYAKLCKQLLQEGLQIWLSGSQTDRSLLQLIKKEVPGVHCLEEPVDPKDSLGFLAAMISLSQVFVGNDSGPMHLARAQGIKTVALFGPTFPGYFDFKGHRLLWSQTNCAPCTFNGFHHCPKAHHLCMKQLTVQAVLDATFSLLAEKNWKKPLLYC